MTAAVIPDLVGATLTEPGGQARLVLPRVPRHRHRTGVQVPCAACARSANPRPRLGMPYRFADDPTPLCIPCWTAERDRRQAAADEELLARYWAEVGGVEVDQAADVVTVAQVEAEACPACGRDEPGLACWLCSFTWVARAREQYADESDDDAEAVDLEFSRIAARSEAEDRVADATGWVQRLQAAVSAYPAGGSRGRVVELVADLLARLDAARTSTRGRPSITPYVGAAVAVDARWESGRAGMPGRERTAWLVGCSDRAVYNGWKEIVAVGWATRTRIGGRNSLERREETGRWNDRAEFDVVQLYRSEVDTAIRARYVPEALGVLGTMLERALAALGEAQDALDELRARTEQWTDWAEQVHRLQLRAAVAKVRATITDPLPALALTANICRSHPVSRGEYVSSCLIWGLFYSPSIMIHSEDCRASAEGREKANGASRAPTGSGRGDLDCIGCTGGQANGSHRVDRPRTVKGVRRRSRAHVAPEWASWAYPLAQALISGWWPWLARSPRPWVATVLGTTLGEDWTAQDVIDLVRQRCGPPAPAAEIHAPAAYLAELLRQALTSGVPVHRARAHDEARRDLVAAQATAGREHAAAVRAADDARAADAVPATASRAADAIAALRMRLPAGHRRPERVAQLGGPAPAPAATVKPEPEPWPETAQPGAGLPPALARHRPQER